MGQLGARYPGFFEVGDTAGLARACVANCDTLQTVPRAQLRRRIARLAPAKLRALDDALRFGLGLD